MNKIIDAAKLAEDIGFYSVTLPTHMTMPPSCFFRDFQNLDILDDMVVVPAIAAATTKIKIGFNSLLLPMLLPYEWAKYLATMETFAKEVVPLL